MILDYYQILGVPPDATPDAIKRAYRQRAMKCHPDRGGTHAQMLEINEAFEVLSSPALRTEYDYARAHPQDYAAQARSAAESSQARKQAQNYPREWAAFESWLNGLASDFKSAKYGQTTGAVYGMKFPTVGESITGWLLIFGGGILGLFLWVLLIASTGLWWRFKIILLVAFVCGGAWVGLGLHSMVGSIIPEAKPQSKNTDPPSPSVIHCPRCSQGLRLPSVTGKVRITCSSCHHVFVQNAGGTHA